MGGVRGRTVQERIEAWCIETPSGCWEWQGAQNGKGYGRITVEGRSLYVHRVAYEAFIGPIPDGLTIDHLCRTRHCANPWHMDPVPAEINTSRAAKGPRSRCRRELHPLDDANTYVSPSGLRVCRACARINAEKRKTA